MWVVKLESALFCCSIFLSEHLLSAHESDQIPKTGPSFEVRNSVGDISHDMISEHCAKLMIEACMVSAVSTKKDTQVGKLASQQWLSG